MGPELMRRQGLVTAIASAVATLGIALLISAVTPRPAGPARVPVAAPPAPARSPAPPAQPEPTTPAQTAPPAVQVSCPAGGPPVGPVTVSIPPAPSGRHHPPFQMTGLPAAGGAVVSSPEHVGYLPYQVAHTIGTVLADRDGYAYVAASDSSRPYLQVEIGTPKPGTCALQLVYTALRGEDGFRTQQIATLPPGPALARHHAAFACGWSSSGSGLSACAWAATSAGGRMLFGMVEFLPVYKPDGFAEHQLSVAEITASADIVFSAIDG